MSHLSRHDVKGLQLRPVDRDNWRAVAGLRVHASQEDFVASGSYYLALCCYGQVWKPLAVVLDGQVIGFMMWAVDPQDGACWLGGITIDAAYQGHGYGKSAVQEALRSLHAAHGFDQFALSYNPDNTHARRLYARLGFVESGEMEDDELVARFRWKNGEKG